MDQERQTLLRAQQLLQQRRYADCATLLAPLCAAGRPLAALGTAAMAHSLAGNAAAATDCFERYLAARPADAQAWNNFGNHLRGADPPRSLACYRRAIALAGDFRDARFNLALLHHERREHRAALEALSPGPGCTPREHALAASLHLRLQQWPQAARHLRAQLAHDPADARSRLNLAVALRRQGEAAEALAVLEAAGPGAPAALGFERAAILLDAGRREDALALLEGIVAREPAHLAAHEAIDRIHFENGATQRVGESLARAWQQCGDARLPAALALRLERVGQRERALGLVEGLGPEIAQDAEVQRLRARLLVAAGRAEEAERVFRDCLARHPADSGAALDHARFLMLQGRAREAAARLERSLAAAPEDQLLLANLATAWKLDGDARHRALFDAGRFVRTYDLAAHGLERAFFAGLAALLRRMHGAAQHPIDQSLRGGTQTLGNLLLRREPAILRLRQCIESVVADYIAALPRDDADPFLRRRPARFRIAGSWSVLLRPGGFHVPHTHGQGWLSSALYVDLPAGLADTAPEGCLEFGRSDLPLAPAQDPPELLLAPEVGRLVLFPSYLWHGTVPFTAPGERLTVAFDVNPAD